MDHLRPRRLLRAVCHDRLVQISGKAPVLSLVPAAGEGHHLQGVAGELQAVRGMDVGPWVGDKAQPLVKALPAPGYRVLRRIDFQHHRVSLRQELTQCPAAPALAPQLRGQSWGSRALREFLAEGDPVVLEIDPPEDPVSRRRKGFYEGLGLVSNPWPHIHPPYRLEFSGHALEVMTFPGGWDEGQYRRFARYLDETVMADRPQKAAGA